MTTIEEQSRYVRSLLDAYYTPDIAQSVASEDPDDNCVPSEMHVGSADEDGWVQWRIIDPRIAVDDIKNLEGQFGIVFPDLFRAYLLSACHFFDQARSTRYDQQVIIPHIPSNNPLGPITAILSAWQPLISADYIPFAEWGDGFGPMCYDAQQGMDNDYQIVWMDHEILVPLGPDACRDRTVVAPHAQLLYSNTRAFIEDIFKYA